MANTKASSKDTGGAPQPVIYTSLRAPNKSRGRIATFAVRLCGGRVDSYNYRSKHDGREMTGHKFELWLVGTDSHDYCVGYVKGSEGECKAAKEHDRACRAGRACTGETRERACCSCGLSGEKSGVYVTVKRL